MENTCALNFAILGCGRAGHFHMTSIRQLAGLARLKWVVDTDEDKARACARTEQCHHSSSAEVVFQDPEVDAIVVASVTYSHYGYCKAALQAGKAVFTEKPISHSPAELKEIIDLAEEKGVAFVVGYQRRVDKNFRELHRQVKSGAIGGLRLLKCCSRDNPLPPLEYLRVSGGIFCDMLCHDFDMIHFLSDEVPVEVFSMGHCYNEDIKAMDDIDTVVVNLKFESGLMAIVDCSRTATYGYDQRVEALGSDGMACCNNEPETTIVVAGKSGFQHPPVLHSFPQRYERTYAQELAEFVRLVRNGEVEPTHVLRRHIDLEKVTAAAEISWRLGRAVRLAELDELRHVLPHSAHDTELMVALTAFEDAEQRSTKSDLSTTSDVATSSLTDIVATPDEGWTNLTSFEMVSVDAGKALEEFRNYKDSDRHSIVEQHYSQMRKNQTVEYVQRMYEKYHKFDKAKMTVAEAFLALEGYVDSSDPDTELPNMVHMLQTAEAIRAKGHPDWMQLTGLLHDMGKIMYLWGEEQDGQIGRADFAQWGLGGDTWVVGLPIPATAVFPEFSVLNPDKDNPAYQGEFGMYEAGCGLENLLFAYGHDEYLYRMLIHNETTLPKEGLAMIRYHSCYPLHKHGEYAELLREGDADLLDAVRTFNQFDLYTKADSMPDVAELWPYYQGLIDKYLPGKLDW